MLPLRQELAAIDQVLIITFFSGEISLRAPVLHLIPSAKRDPQPGEYPGLFHGAKGCVGPTVVREINMKLVRRIIKSQSRNDSVHHSQAGLFIGVGGANEDVDGRELVVSGQSFRVNGSSNGSPF